MHSIEALYVDVHHSSRLGMHNASRGQTTCMLNTETNDKVNLCSSGTLQWLVVSSVASRHSFTAYKHQMVLVMTTANSVYDSPGSTTEMYVHVTGLSALALMTAQH